MLENEMENQMETGIICRYAVSKIALAKYSKPHTERNQPLPPRPGLQCCGWLVPSLLRVIRVIDYYVGGRNFSDQLGLDEVLQDNRVTVWGLGIREQT